VNDDPKRRMVIVATHRRTTASHADRIYQLVNGRLVSAGDSAFDAPSVGEVKIA
jgi:ABC-type transport system involved in cytochrome bd biosynthesis fused ATPase/permease subunit